MELQAKPQDTSAEELNASSVYPREDFPHFFNEPFFMKARSQIVRDSKDCGGEDAKEDLTEMQSQLEKARKDQILAQMQVSKNQLAQQLFCFGCKLIPILHS